MAVPIQRNIASRHLTAANLGTVAARAVAQTWPLGLDEHSGIPTYDELIALSKPSTLIKRRLSDATPSSHREELAFSSSPQGGISEIARIISKRT